MPLGKLVFDRVCKRLSGRARDILLLAETGNHFENWCSSEAFLACREEVEWKVFTRPYYSEWGCAAGYGDLGIMAIEQELIAEFAVCIERTQGIFKKLNEDFKRLEETESEKDVPLLLILSVFPTSQKPVLPRYQQLIAKWNGRFRERYQKTVELEGIGTILFDAFDIRKPRQ